MLASYYDESAVDGGGPVSAVGGMLLDCSQYFWLDVKWNKALEENRIPPRFDKNQVARRYIHMKDFGKDGDLATFPVPQQRKLFEDLAGIIDEIKLFSIGSILSPADFKKHFGFLRKSMTIHGSCFLQAAVTQAKIAEDLKYRDDIPFMLDEGCPDRKDIDWAHTFLKGGFPRYPPQFPTHAGPLAWADDKNVTALQAADVIAWAVRRRASETSFGYAARPLETIVQSPTHIENKYEEPWMIEVISNTTKMKARSIPPK